MTAMASTKAAAADHDHHPRRRAVVDLHHAGRGGRHRDRPRAARGVGPGERSSVVVGSDGDSRNVRAAARRR